ncbi:pyrimidine-nucleoside phosphorylase [Weissella koreensis]|uniref:Pyrimidine-nucleoside phosphorylase n=1 Tax=Weissella koreensis TaxID=165096 RepID=A0A7H1MM61_9LACO|nr:pyrimidine-nucleoside phosphorylase [Weissella koreensis]AVH75343.1 pyrimidine-nucleoside phosphorylase [Weissella koreensis]EJF34843.1 thymidine phosphorylase [Weissella koreensis KCTC 3621]QGN20568.1 pyrimidine-nucleoside phosphorylase [Weissella koreensis]QNT64547.1 pyrimidine-nucleoside phosphorylase [Weissella koreensis]
MTMLETLMKKRNNEELTSNEIETMIQDFTAGKIPDYQISAFLMATYFTGMTIPELTNLTMAMMHSGDVLDLSTIEGIKVDKHSTGGVGDKVSLPLAPMLAALGIKVPMISGRGLGHTGGTLDKLEAIPGYQVEISEDEFKAQIDKVGTAIIGATGNIAPADKKMYALRDVTATVDSIPLIAASIMSKKLATGNNALVLDVKTGSGAFMKEQDQAEALAQIMVKIGKEAGMQMQAVISDMNQPLGNKIGNTLEIEETLDTLKGQGPKDLLEVTLTLAAPMVVMAQKADDEVTAREMLMRTIEDGSALVKFGEMITAQGGDNRVLGNYNLMPHAKFEVELTAPRNGYLSRLDADAVGIASMQLGGGRTKKDDVLDYGVGITLHKKLGDAVTEGESLMTIATEKEDITEIMDYLQEHLVVGDAVKVPTLIHKIIK